MLRHFYKFGVTFNYYYSSLTVDDESLNLLAFLSFFVAKVGGGGGVCVRLGGGLVVPGVPCGDRGNWGRDHANILISQS